MALRTNRADGSLTTTTDRLADARRNGLAHLETIEALLEALDQLQEDPDHPQEVEGETFEDEGQVLERLGELPLEVSHRAGWFPPGEPGQADLAQVSILLTTGGPACRVLIDLEEDTAQLQVQDWGTPWTAVEITPDQEEGLARFAELVGGFEW